MRAVDDIFTENVVAIMCYAGYESRARRHSETL